MKAVTFAVIALCIVLVSCRPDKSDLQKAKAEAARKKACLKDCSTAPIQPVCAGKTGEKPRSFGSMCALNNHNCEHAENLAVTTSGECPGGKGTGVRLS